MGDLFLLNIYDFIVTRNEDYAKIKNQLPKWVQKYNKVIIKKFTGLINDENNKKGIAAVMGLTFILGLTLSVTELVCTGQIYVAIVNTVRYEEVAYAYFLLLSYNIMFIIPLIIIAVVAIRGNKAYEHIRELEKEGFVSSKKYGRTRMLNITRKFFEKFDVDKDVLRRFKLHEQKQ